MPEYSADVSHYGWTLIARGIVLFLLGLVAFAAPGSIMFTLIFVFAAFVLASAVFAVGRGVTGIAARGQGWLLFLVGVLGVIVGIRMFRSPGVTMLMILWAIGIWAILSGIMEIAAGIRLRRQITGEWRMILAGVLSAVFGVILIWSPVAGGVALAWTLGIAAMAYGIMDIVLGFNVRKAAPEIGTTWREEHRRRVA
jgi:uncharacterized membrane protein HdeD (DUF308 family)